MQVEQMPVRLCAVPMEARLEMLLLAVCCP